MFRKSSSSSAHLLSNGSCNFLESEAQPGTEAMDISPFPSLVYYAGVAKGSMILAEYTADTNSDLDLATIAATCLENVPPLHIRFSYTTNLRRFICILDGALTYCSIVDEALSKADAFSFLFKIRDAFKAFGKGRSRDSMSVTLAVHFLDEEMLPVMRNIATQFVGVPQREKDRMQAELQELQGQRDVEVEMEVSSPSADPPLCDTNNVEFDSKTEEKPQGSKCTRMPLIGRIRKEKDTKNQENVEEDRAKVTEKGNSLEITVDGGSRAGTEKTKSIENKLAWKMWRRNLRLVIMLDALACLILLAVWLGVCGGISCLKT